MKIILPNKKGNPNITPEIETNILVVIGANGSGKTRFGTEIENKHLAISLFAPHIKQFALASL